MLSGSGAVRCRVLSRSQLDNFQWMIRYASSTTDRESDETATFTSGENSVPTIIQHQASRKRNFSQEKDHSNSLSYKLESNKWTVNLPSRHHHEVQSLLSGKFYYENVLRHFLPSDFPMSVASGYKVYSLAAAGASVAGSAGMVLSTQCLLVSVVGGSTASTSLVAGSMNWIIKDGIGQLGGVLFASRVGESKLFDADPKFWRSFAALTLDSAALLEIATTFFAGGNAFMILPVACVANVLKNIGYLTSSASRAALHQSLAVTSNLADVTAKSGSQNIASGLVGTGLGVTLSMALENDTTQFIFAFGGLLLFHQSFTYLSLASVHLNYFNKQRLCLVLTDYLDQIDETDTACIRTLSPREVANREVFFPLFVSDETKSWLRIGKDLRRANDRSRDILLDYAVRDLRHGTFTLYLEGELVYLTFSSNAVAEDLIMGMLQAMLLHRATRDTSTDNAQKYETIDFARSRAKALLPSLMESLKEQGWKIENDATHVEPAGAVRLHLRDD